MKVIIAGMRDYHNYNTLVDAINESGYNITEVVCGKATGVDTLGKRWAVANRVHIASFPADWAKHGNSAGPLRNAQMARYADALIAIWDGKSRGTANMIQQAKNNGLLIYIKRV